jgi:hypothetical protein
VRAQRRHSRRSQRHALLVGFDLGGNSDIHADWSSGFARTGYRFARGSTIRRVASRWQSQGSPLPNAIDARQSRVSPTINPGDGANRNLTKLAALRFMSIEAIAIGLARNVHQMRTAHDFRRSHGDPAGAQIFERA